MKTVVVVPWWACLLGWLLVLPWLLLYAAIWSIAQILLMAIQYGQRSGALRQ